ncbi:MAG TPA: PqqD family protein, partial [Anaerolineaceae bacterium]
MQSFSALKSRLFNQAGRTAPVSPPAPGIYHFQRQEEGEKSRLHLRVEEDGKGFLLVNASRIYHLNPSAVVMAYFTLNKTAPEQAVSSLQLTFDVTREQARTDYTQFVEQFPSLIHPDGACSIHDLELETIAPFSARP